MKHIEKYNIFEASLINRKVNLLEDLSLGLRDDGYFVSISKETGSISRRRKISVLISNDNITDEEFKERIQEYLKDCESFGMNVRAQMGGSNFTKLEFDAYGYMTDSEYIRNINENKIYTHKGIDYDAKWKLPTSEIRLQIMGDVEEMGYEVTDLDYSVRTGSWIKGGHSNNPYVWIGGKPTSKFKYEDIMYLIGKLESYFDSMGFKTKEEFLPGQSKEKLNQVYLIFEPKKNLE